VQQPIGAHALLADGRTAALVGPDGDVAWLCWPRVDSAPCLLSILDEQRGGCFVVRPEAAAARLAERGYVAASLVLRSVWTTPTGRLTVTDALAWDGPQRLVRRLHADGGRVSVRVTFVPALDAARARARLERSGDHVVASGAGVRLALRAPVDWRIDAGMANGVIDLDDGDDASLVLGDAGTSLSDDLGPTVAHWEAVARRASGNRVAEDSLGVSVLGGPVASSLLLRSATVFTGLRQRGGALVAAPTTSLPQWPGSSRTWDYRYAWLRDNALAALAMLRLGMVEDASAVGEFCGDVCAGGDPAPTLRVDGTAAPFEEQLDHLAGFYGARPVRIGNAAATQAQLDVLGEVLDLAWALFRAHALPTSLRRAVPQLADALVRRWQLPDHGIWEPRVPPRHHTHSRVMAWTGLRRAAALADHGAVSGSADAWRSAAATIRDAVLGTGSPTAPLLLHAGGGGADAALTLLPLVGFLPCGDPRVTATLDNIVATLGRNHLLDRYLPEADGLADPCAPFVFPTFWLAAALQRCGGDGAAPFAAASAARGDLDLLGEVVDPAGGGPLGNYPQVQSHAALVMAAVAPALKAGEVA
jgi:GH15 family glucan-1,4-alpha-glucosidase